MEGHGNITRRIVTHIQELVNRPKPKVPAQVRPPEGWTTAIRQDAPNQKVESHDITNHDLKINEDPARDAKNDDNKSFCTGNGWNPKRSGCTESDRRWPPRYPGREDNNGYTRSQE